MTNCVKCGQSTTQAILLTENGSDSKVFCLNCAVDKPLTSVPAEEKTITLSSSSIVEKGAQQELSIEEHNKLRTLSKDLEMLAGEFPSFNNQTDILGIPTFRKNCSICSNTLKPNQTWFLPNIRTNLTGDLEIRICTQCRKQKTVRSLLNVLENIIEGKKVTKQQKLMNNVDLETKLHEVSNLIVNSINTDPYNKKEVKELRESFFNLSLDWNISIIEQVRQWPQYYTAIIDEVRENEELQLKLSKLTEIANEISNLAEKQLMERVSNVEPYNILEEVPILAVQVAEIHWAREKREMMRTEI